MIPEARWPDGNPEPMEPSYARVDAIGTQGELVDYDLPTPPAGESWVGASVHIQGGYGWTTYTLTVGPGATAQVLPLLGLPQSPGVEYAPKPNNKYYITGKKWLHQLDHPGAWFIEGSTLYLSLPDPPQNHQVEIKLCPIAFDLTAKNNVTLTGLNLFASTIKTDGASHDILLNGLTASYLNHYARNLVNPLSFDPWGPWQTSGLVLDGWNNTLMNSSLTYSSGNALRVAGHSDPSLQTAGQTIINNLILNADYQGTAGAAITLWPPENYFGESGSLLHWNSIQRAGRDGIRVVGTRLRNHEISHNEVEDTGMLTQDNGGIYTFATGWGPGNANETAVRIHHNRVHDLQAKGDGMVFAHSGAGIYLDAGSSNFLVHHNVVWNAAGDGLRLNGDGVANTYSKANRAYFNTLGLGQALSVGSCCATDFTRTRLIGNIFSGGVDPIIPLNSDFGENLQALGPPPEDPIDPRFVDPSGGSYLLQYNSPAIDALDDPNYPIGEPLQHAEAGMCDQAGLHLDQGAYEYTPGYCNWPAGCSIGGCFGRVTDDIRDWSRTQSHTVDLAIESSNGWDFWGDESRITGVGGGAKEIVWKRYGLESVSITAFAGGPNPPEPLLTLATSVDGVSWTARVPQLQSHTSLGTWQRRTYTIFNFGTANFVRLQWSGGNETVQIGSANLTFLAWSARLLSDPLNDDNQIFKSLSSCVWQATCQWPQPPGSLLAFDNSTNIFGDPSRLYRNTNGEAQVVWKHPGMHSFLATVYQYTAYGDGPLSVEVSFDGQIWRQVEPVRTGHTIPETPGWEEQTYFVDGLTNVNFVKMRWVSSQYYWAPQIGGVRIIH